MSVPPLHPLDIATAMGDREAAGTRWSERPAVHLSAENRDDPPSWGQIFLMLALWIGSALVLFHCIQLQVGR